VAGRVVTDDASTAQYNISNAINFLKKRKEKKRQDFV
jgi:hypothetical protein